MGKLQLDSVQKSFGDKKILNDIYLECATGEIVGLLGRNGSGKSTLLKILFGSLTANSRFLRVNNKTILKNTPISAIKYLPQESFLIGNLKVKHSISLFLKNKNQQELLQLPLIQALLNQKIHNLSYGQRRTIEVLLLLYSESSFLLLDEPFNGLSPLSRHTIKDIILERKDKKGIIITDHDYRNVLSISDRILYMNDGHLKKINDPHTLMDYGYFTQ